MHHTLETYVYLYVAMIFYICTSGLRTCAHNPFPNTHMNVEVVHMYVPYVCVYTYIYTFIHIIWAIMGNGGAKQTHICSMKRARQQVGVQPHLLCTCVYVSHTCGHVPFYIFHV